MRSARELSFLKSASADRPGRVFLKAKPEEIRGDRKAGGFGGATPNIRSLPCPGRNVWRTALGGGKLAKGLLDFRVN